MYNVEVRARSKARLVADNSSSSDLPKKYLDKTICDTEVTQIEIC